MVIVFFNLKNKQNSEEKQNMDWSLKQTINLFCDAPREKFELNGLNSLKIRKKIAIGNYTSVKKYIWDITIYLSYKKVKNYCLSYEK